MVQIDSIALETVFALYVLLIVSGIVGAIAVYRLRARLQALHPETWIGLGSPRWPFYNLRSQRRLVKFIWHGEFRDLPDDRLRRLGNLARASWWANYVLIAGSLAIVVYFAFGANR